MSAIFNVPCHLHTVGIIVPNIHTFHQKNGKVVCVTTPTADLVCFTLCPFSFAIILARKSGPSCFAFIIFWMSCCCKVPVALPHSVVGWSAVCVCGISFSNSLTF